MRIRSWFPTGLLCAVGLVQALTPEAFGAWGVTIVNNGSCTMSSWMRLNGGAWNYGSAVYAGTTGVSQSATWNSGTVDIELHNGSTVLATHSDTAANLTSIGGWTFTQSSCSAPVLSTNYCYSYHLVWTNCSPFYAQPYWWITTGNGTVYLPSALSANYGLNVDLSSPLAPGGVYDRWVTNCFGTNSVGGGGTWRMGDSRPDTQATWCPDRTGAYAQDLSTTTGSQSSGGSSGPGGASGGPVVGTGNTNSPGGYAGGSTNLATQHDIFVLADASVGAMAGVEKAVSGVNSNLVTLQSSQNTNFALLSTNVNALGTNLNAVNNNLGAMGTNLYGLRTNTAAGWSNVVSSGLNGTNSGSGTNGTSDGSNIVAAIKDFEGMVSNRFQAQSDAVNSAYTNGMSETNWVTGASNAVAGMGSNINVLATEFGFQSGGGVDSAMGFWSGNGPGGLAPPSDWGVLVASNPWYGVIYSIDMKPVVAMQPLEDRFPGLRIWFRTAVMWIALFWLGMKYMEELREAVFQVAVIPESPAVATNKLLEAFGSMGGPAGYLGMKAVGVVLNASSVLGLVAVLAFLPSVLVALKASLALSGVTSATYLAAQASVVMFGPGNLLQYFIYLTGFWFPTFELGIFALNYAIMRIFMNNTVSLLMGFMRIKPYFT